MNEEETGIPMMFDAETAEHDWGSEKRVVKRHIRHPHGIRVTLVNGWSFSVVWSYGSLSEAAMRNSWTFRPEEEIPYRALNAEVMPMKPGDEPVVLQGDGHVAGFVTPEMFLRSLEAAERNDEDGVIDALLGDLDA